MVEIKDAYVWGVLLKGGEYVSEYDIIEGYAWADVKERAIQEIWLQHPDRDVSYGHQVKVPEGASPVFFRRRFHTIPLDGTEEIRKTVHCIGWRSAEQEVYLFVFENGSTVLSNDVQAV